MVIQRNNGVTRFSLLSRGDKEELRGNEDRFEHQAQGRRVGEFVRARQIEAVLADQISAEATRAKAAESALPINPLPVATPSWIITASSTPPANYLWSGLTMQSTGVPTPEAQILLGGNPQSVSFTFYLHLRVN